MCVVKHYKQELVQGTAVGGSGVTRIQCENHTCLEGSCEGRSHKGESKIKNMFCAMNPCGTLYKYVFSIPSGHLVC